MPHCQSVLLFELFTSRNLIRLLEEKRSLNDADNIPSESRTCRFNTQSVTKQVTLYHSPKPPSASYSHSSDD